MFTGIVTEVGRVVSVRALDAGVELTIVAPHTAPRLQLGSSVAINGVCLTVTTLLPDRFTVQAVGATMTSTTFGFPDDLTGSSLNLEPSLRAGDELGGHLVSGHVDGVGSVVRLESRGDAIYLTISIPVVLARYVARRGSIALDGVSLTVADLEEAGESCRISLSIIPHTWTHTIMNEYQPGRPVNIEVDSVARYLERLVAARGPAPLEG
ncbi:MAG: riboflavin synthase [Candidatus Eisenbacteria bacterium]|nr:riboflavin synthase [Candidatus Eisenbacteria bacterium]